MFVRGLKMYRIASHSRRISISWFMYQKKHGFHPDRSVRKAEAGGRSDRSRGCGEETRDDPSDDDEELGQHFAR